MGDACALRLFLDHGASTEPTMSIGFTALILAAQFGNTQTVSVLLKESKLDWKDDTEATVLHHAALNRHDEERRGELMRLLLTASTSVLEINAQASNGRTALYTACSYGHWQIMKVLLEHGANPALKSVDGDTVLDFARNNGHKQCVELLESIL